MFQKYTLLGINYNQCDSDVRFGSAMNNVDLLMVFFGVLGLICLLIPKLIYVLYKEITNLGSESTSSAGGGDISTARLNTIRIVGIGVLAVVGWVYFFQ